MAQGSSSKWAVLAAVQAGTVMGPLDASIVYIALPRIAQDFKADAAAVSWVSMAYLLFIGCFILIYGRLGDLFGKRGVYLAGVGIFTLGSVGCGMAPNLYILIACRALQAIGAGMSVAIAPGIITAVFPRGERGRALGLNAMVAAAGLSAGPALGGFITQHFDWRLVFYVNVPIGLIALLWGLWVIPFDEKRKKEPFDWAGAVLIFISLTSGLLLLTQGRQLYFPGNVFLLLFLCIAGIYGFWMQERRSPYPMLDLGIFTERIFTAGNLAAFFNYMAQYVVVFTTTFFLQQRLGFGADKAGMVMTAFPLSVLAVAPVAGTVSDYIGSRWLAVVGSLCCAAGAGFLGLISTSTHATDIAWRLAVFGVGTGLFQSPNNSAVMGSVPRERLGIAGGVMAMSRSVGMTFGIAVAAVFTERQAGAVIGGLTGTACREAYLTAAAVAAVGAMVSATVYGRPRKPDMI
ncbi:MAG: MFS transporter [Bacillota bacterium]